jgi:hypothetical protein
MWNRLLLLLRLRNEFDYAPPGLGPEVNHAYEQDSKMRCCMHCGGGKKHKIHRQPWDEKRMAEIVALRTGRGTRWVVDKMGCHLEIGREPLSPKDWQPE